MVPMIIAIIRILVKALFSTINCRMPKKVLKNIRDKEFTLGVATHIVNDKLDDLSKIYGGEFTAEWWKEFYDILNKCTKKRNGSSHN